MNKKMGKLENRIKIHYNKMIGSQYNNNMVNLITLPLVTNK